MGPQPAVVSSPVGEERLAINGSVSFEVSSPVGITLSKAFWSVVDDSQFGQCFKHAPQNS